jgi:hypothetical protein
MGAILDLLLGRPHDATEQHDDEHDDEPEVECPSLDCGCRDCGPHARLCIHEAGHVVAHLWAEQPFIHVYAHSDRGGGDGKVVTGDLADPDDDPGDVVVCFLAGAAAERLFYGGEIAAQGDYDAVEVFLSDPDVGITLEQAEAEAEGVVDDWGDVLLAVARALFESESGDLTYDEVIGILDDLETGAA